MGKTPRNYSKGASRGFVNYSGRHGTVHSKTYQDAKYGQNQTKFIVGQRDSSRERSSGLIRLTTNNKK
jgi:hypothetical protein